MNYQAGELENWRCLFIFLNEQFKRNKCETIINTIFTSGLIDILTSLHEYSCIYTLLHLFAALVVFVVVALLGRLDENKVDLFEWLVVLLA